jgi:hypothetical protein
MSSNSRFALDERRYVIDGINVANSGKAYCPEGDPEDDKHLREYVLQVCLREMLKKLIINIRPTQEHGLGERYQPSNGWDSIWMAILGAVQASHLNAFDPTLSIRQPSTFSEYTIKFANLFAQRWDCSKEYEFSPASDLLEVPFHPRAGGAMDQTGRRLANRVSTWPRDHFWRRTIVPRRSRPTT